MKFSSCQECGGRCCKDFGIPLEYVKSMFNHGVPIDIFKSKLDENPRRYFELHDGITISDDGKRFIVGINIDLKVDKSGGYIHILSKCSKLSEKGECMIYDERPDVCRNFTEETKEFYNVPEGCKYET